MEYKQIRISMDLKDKLDELKEHGESYTLAISRLIQEHDSLKRERESFAETTKILSETVNRQSEELKSCRQDKDHLMMIALQTDSSIALPSVSHSSFFAITEVLKDSSYSDDDKLAYLKIYLKPSIKEDKEAVLSMINSIKANHQETVNLQLLDNLFSFIQETY